MELVLPRNYVEIEQEEMEYLDGGWSKNDAKGFVIGLIASGVGMIAGKAISKFMIGGVINFSAVWVANVIDKAIIAAYVYPGKATAIVVGILGAAGITYYIYQKGKSMGKW